MNLCFSLCKCSKENPHRDRRQTGILALLLPLSLASYLKKKKRKGKQNSSTGIGTGLTSDFRDKEESNNQLPLVENCQTICVTMQDMYCMVVRLFQITAGAITTDNDLYRFRLTLHLYSVTVAYLVCCICPYNPQTN